MKYTISYSVLLLNTILDTIKRENRRTIDGEDIINFEKELKKISKKFNLPMEFESMPNAKSFLMELEPYVFMSNQDSDPIYTLLPWINETELENSIKDTIFTNMEVVYDVTKENLRFKRTARSVQRIRNVERQVNENFLKMTRDNITFFEQQKLSEEKKLQKIKNNIHMRG